jgi:hypothetical protein
VRHSPDACIRDLLTNELLAPPRTHFSKRKRKFSTTTWLRLETDVVPCLWGYPIMQLAIILQQGSQLLQDRSSEEYPPTPTSLTHRPTPLSGKAEGEEVGSTVPLLAVERERFSYWCFDLLFFFCSDTAKGRSMSLGCVYERLTKSSIQIMRLRCEE